MIGLRAAAIPVEPDTWGNHFTLLHDNFFKEVNEETPSVMVNVYSLQTTM